MTQWWSALLALGLFVAVVVTGSAYFVRRRSPADDQAPESAPLASDHATHRGPFSAHYLPEG